VPQPQGYKSTQYEFTDEHNRTVSSLSNSMRAFAGLMKILGLVFAIFCALTVVAAVKSDGWHNWGWPVILGAIGLLAVMFGFWTSSASNSFRKIAETKNEDVWHLMNALGSLKNMYATMRTMIIAALVLAVVGAILIAIGMMTGSTPATK
jgi:flagellar biosynthesis protein FlhB